MNNNKQKENKPNYIPLGMCLGISVGTAIGVATNNLAIYMPIGLSIGICIGSVMDAKNRKKSDSTKKIDN